MLWQRIIDLCKTGKTIDQIKYEFRKYRYPACVIPALNSQIRLGNIIEVDGIYWSM